MKKCFFIFILLIFCLFLYAKYIEPKCLNINEYSIYNDNLPDGFNGTKIVHFSDLLINNETDFNNLEKVFTSINDQNPDIVVFTGDIIKEKISDEIIEKTVNLFKKIKANLYRYAILGDNDNKTSENIIKDANFILLNNESVLLYNKDKMPIMISGGDNIKEEDLIDNKDKIYNFKIALIHKPDSIKAIKQYNFDLVLAGHNLGGEIYIPFYGALYKKEGARTYTNNYYNIDDTIFYISNGIGIEKTGLRLFNKPSFSIYRLYK